MGFDDHDENYITLNSRGLSKLILDQFDKNRESQHTLIDGDKQHAFSGDEQPNGKIRDSDSAQADRRDHQHR
jgi:hypothetical protein